MQIDKRHLLRNLRRAGPSTKASECQFVVVCRVRETPPRGTNQKRPRRSARTSQTRCVQTGISRSYASTPNVAPHLPPPRRKVERQYDIQILPDRRTESAGGG